MDNNFNLAVQFAAKELQGFYDRGGSFKALNQKGRSEILEVFSEDFDWQANLEMASKDFHAFDSLKRYCAHLIRTEKVLPEELRHWIADHLEGIVTEIKQPKGGVVTGLENNFLIPRLVEKVAVKFNLDRTRNDATEPYSACDVVHKAILLIPEAIEIKSRQYRTIKKAYEDAKALEIFVGK